MIPKFVNNHTRFPRALIYLVVVVGLGLFAVDSLPHPSSALAATPSPPITQPCGRPIPASPYGKGTYTAAITSAGSYMLWSRVQTTIPNANSYYLDVYSCGSTVVAGAVGSWVWVSSGPVMLPSGNQLVTLAGTMPGLRIDRLIFTTDQACTPTGNGDNCVGVVPTPTVSISPNPTPTVTPTPLPNNGDINNDGAVNVFDLSILLSHWSQNASGDLNRDGTVNVFDLSILLSHWTG